MADADDLWTAVKAAYAQDKLIQLTNIYTRGTGAIVDSVGTSAAQHVIDLWPNYVQSEYDGTDARHVAVGLQATIAVLMDRGGAAQDEARERWDEVFGDNGLMARLRTTSTRDRQEPSTNMPEVRNGERLLPWSSDQSMPVGFLPSRRTERGTNST